MANTTQTLPESKLIRALWYAWRAPELNRHRAALDNCTDPDVNAAYAAILEGDNGLARLAHQEGGAAALLDLVVDYAPSEGMLNMLHRLRKEQSAPSLPGEFWPHQQPIMVMDFSKFSGNYPQHDHTKTCKTNWVATGQGETVNSVAPVTFSLWRGYTMQSGAFMMPCEHCRHERVRGFCKHIEKASELYRDENLMRYKEMGEGDAKKVLDKLRKRRERGDDQNYTTFPLENGRLIVLHDAADVGGQPLPTDRGELYDLVARWALNTPKGKRAGHGLGVWGKTFQLSEQPAAADDGEQDSTDQAADQASGGKSKKWRIIGKDYGTFATLLSGYLDTNYNPKGMKVNVDVNRFVSFLEEAGIDYAIDGDVTLNRLKPKESSAKCDNGAEQLDPGLSISPKPFYKGVINGL